MTNNPSGSAEYSAVTSLYDSYRVEKMIFEYIPVLTYNSGFAFAPLGVVFDPDTAGNVTSFSNAMQYDSFRACDLSEHWNVSVVPPRVSSASALTGAYTVYEDGFIDMATPVATAGISWYATGCTTSTLYGNYVFHWVLTVASRH
jgi:hypothetical protein